MYKVLFVFGTRPEAIKIAPVIKEIEKQRDIFQSVVCVTAQHRHMLDQVLNLFRIHPDYDLDIMTPGQDLFDVTCQVMLGLKPIFVKENPDMVLVHGDTTTTMAAALAAYYCRFRVGHVEAGLRTYNRFAPFPEEANRRVTSYLTDLHFTPTEATRQNLLREGVNDEAVFVTGNTVIDALLEVSVMLDDDAVLRERLADEFSFLNPLRKLVLVTGHRRENFGRGFENICNALSKLSELHRDVDILYPVHLNPRVREPVRYLLAKSKKDNLHLIEPVDYLSFVYLMKRSHLIITDSGGIQEEAPSLAKPVLVMREETERPEAVAAGTVKLVGVDSDMIIREASALLIDQDAYRTMIAAKNPYGDGKAAERIARVLRKKLSEI